MTILYTCVYILFDFDKAPRKDHAIAHYVFIAFTQYAI